MGDGRLTRLMTLLVLQLLLDTQLCRVYVTAAIVVRLADNIIVGPIGTSITLVRS